MTCHKTGKVGENSVFFFFFFFSSFFLGRENKQEVPDGGNTRRFRFRACGVGFANGGELADAVLQVAEWGWWRWNAVFGRIKTKKKKKKKKRGVIYITVFYGFALSHLL